MPRLKAPPMSGKIETLTVDETNEILKASDDPRTTALIILALNAGLYLHELTLLKIDSIDWETRTLQVEGLRQRAIKLDEQTYEALAAWSKERPTVRSAALFIASKGERGGLKDAAVEKVLRDHGRRCGLRRELTATLLRDTFAVRLLAQKNIAIGEAAALLAFTSAESIDRYIKAGTAPLAKIPEHPDNRSGLRRLMAKWFPVKPKPARRVVDAAVPAGAALFGRESVLAAIKSDLTRRNSVLLTGPLGAGKSELLKQLAKHYPGALMADAPVPVRALLARVLEKVSPGKKKLIGAHTPTGELLARIEAAGKSDLLLLIDNLDRVKAPEAEIFVRLLDNFTVVAATSATPERLQSLWYKFRPVKLPNLRPEAARQMVRHLTAGLPVDDREMLETRILSLSNGLPLAIVGMVRQVSHEPVIDREAIRDVYHEAGVRYRDWTPFLVILWGVAMVSRFIALGTHSFEGYILAGVGMAALMTTMRLIRMGR